MDELPLESGWIDPPGANPRGGSWAFSLALSLLGSVLFVSYVFLLLAPLPLVYLQAGDPDPRRGRLWAGVALAMGLGLSFAVHGWLFGSLFFFLFTGLPAITLSELLLRRRGPERAVAGAVAAVLLAGSVAAFGYTSAHGQPLVPTVRATAEGLARQGAQFLLDLEKRFAPKEGESPSEENNEATENLKAARDNPAQAAKELPGSILFGLLLLCSLPCLAMIRWNPKGFLRRTGIPRDFLRRWRAPDWLVWPALLCWAFLLLDVPHGTTLAANLSNSLLLIYFFQGMSILAYFLDSLRLRGPVRVFYYGTAILFLTLMVVIFGFLDHWARFRTRSRFQGRGGNDRSELR